MCEKICIGFIEFILKDKSFLDYTNLFSPNEYGNNNKIILKYFKQINVSLTEIFLKNEDEKKFITLGVTSIENLKTQNYHVFLIIH